jgi:ElaB/YqjD/DUF883 family membrane-anchored ribosome-binding protein
MIKEDLMNDAQSDGKMAKELLQGREWVAERLARADEQARSFLTEHPVLSLACAVGIGFLAARWLRSRE